MALTHTDGGLICDSRRLCGFVYLRSQDDKLDGLITTLRTGNKRGVPT